MQSGALPCNAVVGSPRRGYWVSQSSPPDLRSGLPVGSYPVLAGQRENHREGFWFPPRARDNCRLKSLQFFSFLAFYPEPVTTALRQRTVTPTWQRYAVVAGAAGPRREPGSDNPNPRPERISKNPIPSPERVPAQEDGPVLVFPGRSLGPGRTSRYFGGPEQLEDEEKSIRNTRGHGRPGDRRSDGRPTRRSRGRQN